MDEKGHSSTNTLLVYEPPYRLVFTFGEGKYGPDKATEVEFLLKPEGEKVRLILTHTAPEVIACTAVSIEPKAGVPSPTGAVVLAGRGVF